MDPSHLNPEPLTAPPDHLVLGSGLGLTGLRRTLEDSWYPQELRWTAGSCRPNPSKTRSGIKNLWEMRLNSMNWGERLVLSHQSVLRARSGTVH